MPSRFEYERAVRASGLPPMSRLMALTLATWADLKTGVIPPRLMPSLSKLEESTGMARGSVRTHLDRLETDGWLIRKRPTVAAARSEKARTQYKLRVPKGVAVSDSDEIELGQEMTPAGAGDAPDAQKLGQELPQARAGAAPELGQELTTARAGAALSSSFSDLSTSEYQREGARKQDHQPAAPPAPPRPDGRLALHELPDDFAITDTERRWAHATYPGVDVNHETDQFIRYWRSEGRRKRNWHDAWQKWIGDAGKRASSQTRPNLRAVSGGGWQPWTNPEDQSVYKNRW